MKNILIYLMKLNDGYDLIKSEEFKDIKPQFINDTSTKHIIWLQHD